MNRKILNKLSEYGLPFQRKVIKLLLINREFLIRTSEVLSVDYFDNDTHKDIVQKILEYYRKYKTNMDFSILNTEVKKEKKNTGDYLIECRDISGIEAVSDKNYVMDEFHKFCKFQHLKNTLTIVTDMMPNNDTETIYGLLKNTMTAGMQEDGGYLYNEDIDARYVSNLRNPVEFPWGCLNNITGGGLAAGELALVCAPLKAGKSWIITDMAAHAMKIGKNVAFFTLELNEYNIGKRIDSFLTKIHLNDLDANTEIIKDKLKDMTGRVWIKQLTPRKSTLDTIEKYLFNLKQDGFVPDIIIVDYLDLLANRNKFRKDSLEDCADIYTEARALAIEHQIPVVSPAQINRQGIQKNEIDADTIAGSLSKLMIADFAISLSRNNEQKKAGICKIKVMASRLGPDHIAFEGTFNSANGEILFNDDYQPYTNDNKQDGEQDLRTGLPF